MGFIKLNYDWLSAKLESFVDRIGKDITREENDTQEGATALGVLATLILWPFHCVLLTMQIIELPFRLFIDLLCCVKDLSFKKENFEDMLKFMKQNITFSFYKSIEPPVAILPDKYKDGVKSYFEGVIIDASGTKLGM